jgi:RNA-directed DNA polymerase
MQANKMAIRILTTEQLMAELAEQRALTERNSGNKPGTVTQSARQTDSGLARIHAAAKKDSQLRFNNLYHHLTLELLTQAYWNLKRQAASGVDGVTWAAYGENLEINLQDLHTRLHKGCYRPQPSKRIWIDKADGKLRPIGITALEDKVVQQALSWIIQSIFETDFLGFSYGFRQDRS